MRYVFFVYTSERDGIVPERDLIVFLFSRLEDARELLSRLPILLAGCMYKGLEQIKRACIFLGANASRKLAWRNNFSYKSGIWNLRTAYSRFNGRATAFATFCSRMRPFRAVRRPACGNERPMGRALVGPHGALAWSRISIDIARVRSGSLNSMHCARCIVRNTMRDVCTRNEEYWTER